MRRRQRERLGEGLSPPPSRKGLWSPEEDEKLIACIIHNTGMAGCSWAYVAKQAGLDRCGKSCRLRWINYLRPGLKRGSFSSQEERFIIKLQSILGNRWSQIAAHIPGRTDNEIKNYWNSCIKKKLKLKHHVSCTCTTTTNARSNIPSQSDSICNTNSVFSHIHDAFRSSHSAQPYFESMLEGYQTPSCNTFNVVTTGENQFCVSGILESKQEQVQDQDNDLISYFEKWTNADTSTHTHDRVSSHAAFLFPSLEAQGLHTYSTPELPANDELMIESCRTTVPPPEAPATANYSLSSTSISVPAVIQRECLKEEIENDGWGYWSHAVDPGAYITHEAGISIAEDYKSLYEKTTHQSCSPHSFHSQFGSPAIKWPCGQSNDFQGEDEYREPRNMIYDVHLAQIDGGGGLSDHDQDFSIIVHAKTNANSIPTNLGRTGPIILHEKTNANPIPSYLGGGRSGPFEIEWKSVPGQVTNWAGDDIYNFDTGAVSDLASLII